MAISKTRNMLIEVARQLFAKLGVENTTMNDIAIASHRGRRTLYTYFNNKNEVFQAVVESELEHMYEDLQNVASKKLPADEKLLLFFYTRLDAIKKVVFRNGTLRADFFRDIWRVQSVRKAYDKKEIEVLKQILQDGVDEGTLEMPDVDMTAELLHHALRGLELPYIRGLISPISSDSMRYENISHLIFHGIKAKK
ncbi:MAG: TetR/AcrR family transcriptional regulator [Dysgonomonas sp.]